MTTNPDASAGEVAERLFSKLVELLSNAADVRAGVGKVIFFPNGIELIQLTVTVSEFTVEVKVAGEKAPTTFALEAAESVVA